MIKLNALLVRYWISILVILPYTLAAGLPVDKKTEAVDANLTQPSSLDNKLKAFIKKDDDLGLPGLVIKRLFLETPTIKMGSVTWNQHNGLLKCNKEKKQHEQELKAYSTNYEPLPLMELTNSLRKQEKIDDLVTIASLLLAAGAQVHKSSFIHGNINTDNSWSAAATAFAIVIGRPLSGPYYYKGDKIEAWSAESLDKSMAEIEVDAKEKLSYDELPKPQQEHLHDLSEILNLLLEPDPEKRKTLEELVKPSDSLFKPLNL
ncbi:hypothetical protein BDF19DRAFT_489982 [Syncephalis fuscata]|nr:hypothetical protein BDF19DRAFT_489982 [Syncephalis fuscata]